MFSADDISDQRRSLDSFHNADKNHRLHTQRFVDGYHQLLDENLALSRELDKERAKNQRRALVPERKPFILVIVDGNSYIFKDEFLKQGSDGGREAAQLLHDRVRESLRAAHVPDDGPVHVRVFMNVAFISKLLAKHHLAGHDSRSIAPFIAGFNTARDTFDIVDARNDKEHPYENPKVRATFETYAGTSLCGHIVFAGCNDARLLDMFSPYRNRADKITLMRSATWMPGYAGLGLPIEEYSSVFRTTKLDDSVLTSSSARKVFGSEFPSHNKDEISISWRRPSSLEDDSNHEADSITLNKPAVLKQPNRLSFAQTLSKDKASMLPVCGPDKARMIPVNRFDQRLDTYLAESDSQEFDACKGLPKMCTNFHLSSRCKYGSSCRYDHSPIDDSMLLSLQHYLRESPCPRGSACRFLSCYLGHLCARRNCSGGKSCKLPQAMHNIDLDVDRWVKHDPWNKMVNASNGIDRSGNSSPPSSKWTRNEASWEPKPRVKLPLKMGRKYASQSTDSPDSRSCGDSTTWNESPSNSPPPQSEDLIDLGDPANDSLEDRTEDDAKTDIGNRSPGVVAQSSEYGANNGSAALGFDESNDGEAQPVDDDW